VARENLNSTNPARKLLTIYASWATDHRTRATPHGSSSSAAKAARWMLAHFSLFVEELGAQLAEFFTAAVFQLADDRAEWRFIFHGGSPPRPGYLNP
jgi:hypothetical protein